MLFYSFLLELFEQLVLQQLALGTFPEQFVIIVMLVTQQAVQVTSAIRTGSF
jgi:hypothetical protein